MNLLLSNASKTQPREETKSSAKVAGKANSISPLIPKLLQKVRPKGWPKFDTASRDEEFNATWMTLLARLNFDEVHLWPVVKRDTDYLPEDVSAASAMAKAKHLALLAVVADEDCTVECNSDGRFVTVTRPNSRLTFQNHPFLGSVGLYELLKAPYTEISQDRMNAEPTDHTKRACTKTEFLSERNRKLLWLATGYTVFNNALCVMGSSGDGLMMEGIVKVQEMASYRPFSTGCFDHTDDYRWLNVEVSEMMLPFSDVPECSRGFPARHCGLHKAIEAVFQHFKAARATIDGDEDFLKVIHCETTIIEIYITHMKNQHLSSSQCDGTLPSLEGFSWIYPASKKANWCPRECISLSHIASMGMERFEKLAVLDHDGPEEHWCRPWGSYTEVFQNGLIRIDHFLASFQHRALRRALWVMSRFGCRWAAADLKITDPEVGKEKESDLDASSLVVKEYLSEDLVEASHRAIETALFLRALFFAALLDSKVDTSVLLDKDETLPNAVVKVL